MHNYLQEPNYQKPNIQKKTSQQQMIRKNNSEEINRQYSKRLKIKGSKAILKKCSESKLNILPFEMLEMVLSFVEDCEFVNSLKSVLTSCLSFHAFSIVEKEQIFRLVLRRTSLICSNVKHLRYLSRFSLTQIQLGRNLSNEEKSQTEQDSCQIRIENVEKLKDLHISVIEQFETVEIVGATFEYRTLMSLLNIHGKIKHLLFTNCSYSDEEKERPQRNISSHLKTIGMSGRHPNMVKVLTSLPLMNVEEMYIENPSRDELTLIEQCASHLKKLSIIGDCRSSNFERMNQMQQVSIDDIEYLKLPRNKRIPISELHCNTVIVKSLPYGLCDNIKLKLKNVKKIVIREKGFIVKLLRHAIADFSQFEEIIIPETFYDFKSEILTEICVEKLRKVTVMISQQNRALAQVLRFRLEQLLPNCCIGIQEVKRNSLVNNPCDQFESITSNDTNLINEIENIIGKIDNIRNQLVFLREQESQIYRQKLDETMMKLNEILHKNGEKNTELRLLGSEIDQIEGFNTNIKHGLQNVQHAIEIYEELIGKDENFDNIVRNYEETLNSLQLTEHASFHEHFKQLENTFAIIKNVIESKGFSYKLLYKNQWQTDDVVEFYNDQQSNDDEDLEEYANMNLDSECEYPDSDEDLH